MDIDQSINDHNVQLLMSNKVQLIKEDWSMRVLQAINQSTSVQPMYRYL